MTTQENQHWSKYSKEVVKELFFNLKYLFFFTNLNVCIKKDKNLQDTAPTVGYEPFEFVYNVSGTDSNIKVYDLGGGSRVRDLWKHYLSESYGFVFVIDSSNRSRINECKTVFASFVENEKVSGKPILM